MAVLGLILRVTAAVLLVSAGTEKLVAPGGFRESLAGRRFSEVLARPLTIAGIGAFEVSVGVVLAAPHAWPVGLALGAGSFAAFAAVLSIWVKSNEAGNCGCGGILADASISWRHVGLNAVLAAALAGASLDARVVFSEVIDAMVVGGGLALLLAGSTAQAIWSAHRLRVRLDNRAASSD